MIQSPNIAYYKNLKILESEISIVDKLLGTGML